MSLFCISFLGPMLLPTLRLSTTLLLRFRSPFLLLTHNDFSSLSFQLYKSIFYFIVFICIYSFQPTLPWVLTHGIYPSKLFTLLYQFFSFTIWELEPLHIHVVSFLASLKFVQFMLQSILLFIGITSSYLFFGGI